MIIERPLVMGIINVTPDSFYAGSRFHGNDAVLEAAEKMLNEGADIIDIGGQSTRPGSKQVSITEESERVIEAIASVHARFPDAVISIDTYSAGVASTAVAAGASMVNDISAGSFDESMLGTVAKLNVPYIAMHMQGTAETMHQHRIYENVSREVLDFFIERKDACIRAGIKDLIIDPGFGFSKTAPHNFELLKNLSLFRMLDCPILAGLSRKSTIYKTLDITAAEALNGTTVLNTVALLKGANMLRVHDVKEAKEAIKLVSQLNIEY